MMDENVLTDVVPEGTPLPEAEPPQEQPLTKEMIQQMIADAASLAEKQGADKGRREMQGIKDREVAEANKRVRLAEGRARSYEESLSGVDEETQKDIRLRRYENQDKQNQSFAQEEEARRQGETFTQKLNDSLIAHLESLGIDPNDKRVDWAQNESDYLTGRSKFDASVASILKEKATVAESDMEKRLTAKIEETLNKKAVDAGLESHDKSASGGAGKDDFTSRTANPDRPITGEDIKQAKKDGII